MKNKIVILGSTGSIGESLLKIIDKDRQNFEIKLLTANKNYKKLLFQAELFNVKNVILSDTKVFKEHKKKFLNKKINIYNNFNSIKKILKKKRIDYAMSSIVGLDGLYPTIELIKYTKKLAIANKESIICAWNLILKELKKYQTNFIPVDSEHFSIWYALKGNTSTNVKRIHLTASGGPLLKVPSKKFDKLKINKIIKHPNWKMGKKISIDSSTMMNKVFEIIEAKKIFNLKYKQLSILIHPQSYLHAIIVFKDKMIKLIAHDTTMEIPIYNTLNTSNIQKFNDNHHIDLKKLNNLSLEKINAKKFPVIKLINKLSEKNTLFETVIVSANDALVSQYLNKKIKYTDISKNLLKVVEFSDFKKMKSVYPRNIKDIINLSKKVHLKINTMCV